MYISILTAVCIIALLCACNLAAQNKPGATPAPGKQSVVMREVKTASRDISSATNGGLQTFREFFNYVPLPLPPSPDIIEDQRAR